jgi:hypothetical protein
VVGIREYVSVAKRYPLGDVLDIVFPWMAIVFLHVEHCAITMTPLTHDGMEQLLMSRLFEAYLNSHTC